MKKLLFTLFTSHAFLSFAQVPVIDPPFFQPDDEITISYDVTGTNLESLNEAWLWAWLPNLNNFNAPSNQNPANANASATAPAKLSKSTGGGKTTFSITLTPTNFFGKSVSEITAIGLIIKGNDWSDGQTSDHIVPISNGFDIALQSPTGNFGFYDSGESIPILAITSELADIEIFIDGGSVLSGSNITELTVDHTVIDDTDAHEIKVSATNGVNVKEVIYSYRITPTTVDEIMPAGLRDGINYGVDNVSASLVLTAPEKANVYIIGDFNNWAIDQTYLMKRDGDKFWQEVTGLIEGQEYRYQYLVDGEIRIADPYAEKISSPFDDPEIIARNTYPGLQAYPSDKTSEAIGFLQTSKTSFVWDPFTKPAKKDLIIYELLVRDFTDERTFQAATDKLDYLVDLGINAIELMPIMEFEGNESWGYNNAFMFAVDKYYGTELDLKTLINEAHKRGIAVILDIVLNHHFNRSSLVRLYNEGTYGQPTVDNPWFNVTPRHPFNVGSDMNHESTFTQEYIDRINAFWIEEYNIDGYRFDLSKGFTQIFSGGDVGLWGQFDASRIALLERMADEIWTVDSEAYIILEHFADKTEETVLSDYGMMLWSTGLHHSYKTAAKGGSTSLAGLYHGFWGWNDPHYVGYMESHDEPRQMWDLQQSETTATSLQRAKLAATFFLTVPGPKMIWQFGEMGYDEIFDDPAIPGDLDKLAPKPTHWEYLDNSGRRQLFELYKSLINLRTKTQHIQPENFDWNTEGWIKWIAIDNPTVKFHVIGNFDDREQAGTYHFPSTGTWYDYFNGTEFEVTSTNQEVSLQSGEFHIYTSDPIENYTEVNPITGVNGYLNVGSIYPNPSNGIVEITTSSRIRDVTIYAVDGRVVKKISEVVNNRVNVSSLDRGIYFIRVNAADGSLTHKLVKQ